MPRIRHITWLLGGSSIKMGSWRAVCVVCARSNREERLTLGEVVTINPQIRVGQLGMCLEHSKKEFFFSLALNTSIPIPCWASDKPQTRTKMVWVGLSIFYFFLRRGSWIPFRGRWKSGVAQTSGQCFQIIYKASTSARRHTPLNVNAVVWPTISFFFSCCGRRR